MRGVSCTLDRSDVTIPFRVGAARLKVLITTVPFGAASRDPLDALERHGVEYVINPFGRRLKEDELARIIPGFDALIAGTEPITARVIEAADRLTLIARVGIGLDSVDICRARARGVQVAYTPDGPSPAVSELTIGLMLALLRDIAGTGARMRRHEWQRVMGRRLAETTVGIIGMGRVGGRVARHLLGGFPGVRVLAHDLVRDPQVTGVTWTEPEPLLRGSDIVTIHVPLTPSTHGMIGSRELAMMRPDALLINTARGGIVVESDLADALRRGAIAGAAVDVFEHEPYEGELASVDRCLLTCHMGSMTVDCRRRMELEAAEEVVRHFAGVPLLNPVPDAEYALARSG